MRARCSRSIVLNPPIPDAMNTPTRVAMSSVTDIDGIVHRELRRRDGELDEDVHLLDVLLVDELQRIELLDLARDPRRELRGVEVRDRTDAAAPGAEGVPVRLGADAEGRYKSNTGDDDSPAQTSDPRFR